MWTAVDTPWTAVACCGVLWTFFGCWLAGRERLHMMVWSIHVAALSTYLQLAFRRSSATSAVCTVPQHLAVGLAHICGQL